MNLAGRGPVVVAKEPVPLTIAEKRMVAISNVLYPKMNRSLIRIVDGYLGFEFRQTCILTEDQRLDLECIHAGPGCDWELTHSMQSRLAAGDRRIYEWSAPNWAGPTDQDNPTMAMFALCDGTAFGCYSSIGWSPRVGKEGEYVACEDAHVYLFLVSEMVGKINKFTQERKFTTIYRPSHHHRIESEFPLIAWHIKVENWRGSPLSIEAFNGDRDRSNTRFINPKVEWRISTSPIRRIEIFKPSASLHPPVPSVAA